MCQSWTREKVTWKLYLIIKFIDSFIFVVQDKGNTTTWYVFYSMFTIISSRGNCYLAMLSKQNWISRFNRFNQKLENLPVGLTMTDWSLIFIVDQTKWNQIQPVWTVVDFTTSANLVHRGWNDWTNRKPSWFDSISGLVLKTLKV